MKLKDQVAIITGAGRNIGEEIAKLLAENGAKVAVVDKDAGRGKKVAEEIAKAGGHAGRVQADDAAAEHGDLAGQHAGHAAEQHAAANIGLL